MFDENHENNIEQVIVERPEDEILLHICCAPCAEYPLKALREEGFKVDGFFVNPNIHPQEEHEKRLENVRIFSEIKNIKIEVDTLYQEHRWRAFPTESKQAHCLSCYSLRMELAARFAAANGYQTFTTALLVSPWQNHEAIVRAGEAAAKRHGIKFLVRDFRDGYREGQEMAKEDGLYRQKYCGCIYSLGETNPKFRDRYLKEFNLELDDLPTRVDDMTIIKNRS